MSNTAKDKIHAIKGQIERDLVTLTHADDRRAYIGEVRNLLASINAASRRSPHDKHTHAAD